MTVDPDRALLGASLAFAGAAVLGSAVAIRGQLPGQPFGVAIPLSVPAGLAAGWGAGVAAPWPMPAAAVITAATARHRAPSARPGAACAAIGLGCIIGTLIEPVTHRPRSWTPATRLAIGVNLTASAALLGAGAWHSVTARATRHAPRRSPRYGCG
jgi:drug/metabolite transporter (DMT)-like permease